MLLFVGRLMAGVASGAVFAPGPPGCASSSRPPLGRGPRPHVGATRRRRHDRRLRARTARRRPARAVGSRPGDRPVPTPHRPGASSCSCCATLPKRSRRGRVARLPSLPPASASRRFLRVVAPMAPWVFAAPAIAFALLPERRRSCAHRGWHRGAAAITALTALAGVLIQPLARRLDTRRNRSGTVGLLLLVAGLALAAVTTEAREIWMLVPARSCSAAPTASASSPGSSRSRPWPRHGRARRPDRPVLRAHLPRLRRPCTCSRRRRTSPATRFC